MKSSDLAQAPAVGCLIDECRVSLPTVEPQVQWRRVAAAFLDAGFIAVAPLRVPSADLAGPEGR